MRPEKSLFAMSVFVNQTIGNKFTEATIATIDEAYQDTDFSTPLIFILSQGADP